MREGFGLIRVWVGFVGCVLVWVVGVRKGWEYVVLEEEKD